MKNSDVPSVSLDVLGLNRPLANVMFNDKSGVANANAAGLVAAHVLTPTRNLVKITAAKAASFKKDKK